MENGRYWRLRAAEMHEQAAQSKDPFVANGFIALALKYERLAEDGAQWVEANRPRPPGRPVPA